MNSAMGEKFKLKPNEEGCEREAHDGASSICPRFRHAALNHPTAQPFAVR
jgi:hypothetical protein